MLCSVLALAGMGVGNVLAPAWIKSHGHTVLLMTIYGTGLIVGGALGSLATAPAVDGLGGWREALGMWGVAAAIGVPLWAWLAVRERRNPREHSVSDPGHTGRVIHSPTAIALTAMFAVQSMHAYVQFGWLPQIYRDAGLSPPRRRAPCRLCSPAPASSAAC